MEVPAVIERIGELLDGSEPGTSNTSMRIPTALRDAAALAVKELAIAPSATALTTAALRDRGHPQHRRVVSQAQVVADRKRRASGESQAPVHCAGP